MIKSCSEINAVFDGKFQNNIHLEIQHDMQFQVNLYTDLTTQLVHMKFDYWNQTKSDSSYYMATLNFQRGGIM